MENVTVYETDGKSAPTTESTANVQAEQTMDEDDPGNHHAKSP